MRREALAAKLAGPPSSAGHWRSAFCSALLLCACHGTVPPISLASGSWGGDHVALTVAALRTDIEFDCAHGWIDGPVRLDSEGRLAVEGTYVREHGGPIRQGEPQDSHPALYAGTADGTRLTFNVKLTDDGTSLGPFLAIKDKPAQVFKCL